MEKGLESMRVKIVTTVKKSKEKRKRQGVKRKLDPTTRGEQEIKNDLKEFLVFPK